MDTCTTITEKVDDDEEKENIVIDETATTSSSADDTAKKESTNLETPTSTENDEKLGLETPSTAETNRDVSTDTESLIGVSGVKDSEDSDGKCIEKSLEINDKEFHNRKKSKDRESERDDEIVAEHQPASPNKPISQTSEPTGSKKSIQPEDHCVLTEEEEKKLHRQVRIIFFILNIMGFLASFSYWMQSGVLPYLTRKLGVYSEVFGYMQSTYAFYQMIGSPIFGRCGDVFGCRCVMVVSELSAMLTYGMLSFASNVFMLFLSRVPALSQHNLQGSYMIITDISLPEQRAKMLGILGVSHGMGMIVGSSVGGMLTEAVGEEFTPLVAASGNLVAAVLVVIFIPSDTKRIRRQLSSLAVTTTTNTDEIPMSSLLGIKEIIEVLNMPNIKYLLFVKITTAFPFSLVYSFFSMAVMDYFHLGPKVNGILLAYIGVLVIFTQGGLVGIVTSRFSDPYIIKHAIFINTVAFLFLIAANDIFLLCVVFLPLVVGGTLCHIVITAAITKIVPIEHTGSALGLTLALHGLIRTVAPTAGGLIFNNIGWPFFGVVGYTLSLLVSVYIVMLESEDY